jgi:diguanylate cyclase (GGDEF)-like protein
VPLATPVLPLAPQVVDLKPLLASVQRYQDSVQERLADNSAASRSAMEEARARLNSTTQVLTGRNERLAGALATRLTDALSDYQARGGDLVSTADRRRGDIKGYADLVESLDARVDTAINSTDGLLGKLFDRTPLIQLRADLSDVARGPAILRDVQGLDDPMLQSVLASERRTLATLAAQQKVLSHSQGTLWYESMRSDIERLPALRSAILDAATLLRRQRTSFGQQSSALKALIPSELQIPRTAPAYNRKLAASAPPKLAPSATARLLPGTEAPRVATVATAPRATRFNVNVALFTTAALLMLFVLVSTAVGIVMPAHRLILATEQLAAGRENVRVKRGGIRELDRLIVAFNTMALELALARAAARDHEGRFRATISAQTQRLEELAKSDPLTGLDNRRELLIQLNEAIQQALENNRLIGVLFLDIDNFKYINDSMGHLFGDRLLISLAERLRATTRPFGHAGRLGGDEFMVIIDRAQGMEEIQAAGLAVVQAFQEPLTVDGQELSASVSVGASVYPYHARDAVALLQAADAALFRAKALGRSKLSLYSAELAEISAAKITTEQGLRRAIERGEFELVFQPEVSAANLSVAVVEALLRWRTPEGNLIGPEQFLSIAEDCGLIVEINNWVLQSAVETAARWYHGPWPEARVAVNVSPRQLLDQRFVDRLQGLLQEYQLPARCIEIELTESVLQTGPATIDALKRLRAKGVAIALDDFGTGYSSFSSLEKLPLTRVKLDRSLIASIDVSPRSAAIARGIIGMCQGLGLEITAEGVDRTAQLALLVGHRLMYLQGYLLAAPVAREELMPLMSKVAERAQGLLESSQLLSAPNVVELADAARRLSEAG